jgi:hypothetical protein
VQTFCKRKNAVRSNHKNDNSKQRRDRSKESRKEGEKEQTTSGIGAVQRPLMKIQREYSKSPKILTIEVRISATKASRKLRKETKGCKGNEEKEEEEAEKKHRKRT